MRSNKTGASFNEITMQKAVILHQSGQLDAAEKQYRKLLKVLPSNTPILNNLGTLAIQKGDLETAVKVFERSLLINPNQALALFNRGIALKDLNRFDEALVSFDKVIALKPDTIDAYFNAGLILQTLNRFNEALAYYDNITALKPDHADAYINRGNTLYALNWLESALESFDVALSLKPDYVELYSNRGVILHDLKRLDEALASYDHLITLKPDYADVYTNRGNTLYALRRLDEALASYDLAIALKQESAVNYTNRGNVLLAIKRIDEALLSYEHAISIDPNHADAFLNLGNAFQDLKLFEEAIACYDRAINLNSGFASAYFNRGVVKRELKQLDEALLSFETAMTLNPTMDFILGYVLHTKMHLCLWDDLSNQLLELTDSIKNKQKVINPFPLLSLIDDPKLQCINAGVYVNALYPQHPLPDLIPYSKHTKIKIGYFSADFFDHATMHLMAELFECHDTQQFEIYALSWSPDSEDACLKRVKDAFDHFIDVTHYSDQDIAVLAREMEIDIAIDLKGYTQKHRFNVFALRSAPIQVSYLGYPDTVGSNVIDYLIADKTLIPKVNQRYYSEKIVYLPNSYQVNDSKRVMFTQPLCREQYGLPVSGFVFCSFNNNYKITPRVFSSWMRLLKSIDGSVLWIYVTNDSAAKNLRQQALMQDVSESRLIFAMQVPNGEHLSRLQLADLFLDTNPCNAHTTASDALRMGLPVLTCMGESFASRVAASLLNAVNLPELITTNPEDYEALAIDLATHPEKLAAIKAKLLAYLPTAPLYNTPLITQHLESAYKTMMQRYHDGLAPDHIVVECESCN